MARKWISQPFVVVLLYGLAMVITGWLFILFDISHSLLLLTTVPVIVSALFFGRPVYLSMILIGFLVSIWVTYSISDDFQASLQTIIAGGISTLIITEFTHALTRSRRVVLVALQESEAKYRILIEMFPHPILILQDGDIVFANNATLVMMGRASASEPVGEDMLGDIPDSERDRLRASIQGHIPASQEAPEHYETTYRRSNGDSFPVEVFVQQITYRRQPAIQAIVIDITDRVRSRDVLQESEERYRFISEVSSDFAYMARVGSQGEFTIEWVAGANEIITGYSDRELYNFDDWFELIHPNDAELKQEHRGRVLNGESDVAEFRIISKTREVRWVRNSAKPVIDESTKQIIGLYGAVQDVTERLLSEEARKITNQKLRVWVDDLEQRRREDGLLIEMGDLLQSCITDEDVHAVVGQFAGKLFSCRAGAVFVFDDDRILMSTAISWGELFVGENIFAPDDCWALRRGRIHYCAPHRSRLQCPHVHEGDDISNEIYAEGSDSNREVGGHNRTTSPAAVSSSICAPINAQGEILGLFHLQFDDEQPLERWEQLAVAVADRAALALANLKLRRSLQAQSIHDQMTGLFNRRYMIETLDHELRQALLYERSLCVVLLDIDDFKRVNDHFGTEVGDLILERFGSLIKSEQGAGEIVGRYGGDAFMLIWPNIILDGALKRTDSLRALTRSLHIPYLDPSFGVMSISIGVAEFPQHGTSAAELLFSAEAALYQAKNEGRDRKVLIDG